MIPLLQLPTIPETMVLKLAACTTNLTYLGLGGDIARNDSIKYNDAVQEVLKVNPNIIKLNLAGYV